MPNRLKNETSPYLLQHKDNPVDWYPWCSEAFDRAKREDKPVFLSIGYSTCHWCHVMAHESFEDDEVASLLNKYFISVKVDKEQRPDIDSIYMEVCQMFTGSGGWPMTLFLTPEQKPFFAGTYFPKNLFISLLNKINILWTEQRAQILESGDEITSKLNKECKEPISISEELLEDAELIFKQSFDSVNGGFGQAPKFPSPHNLIFLLNRFENTGDRKLLKIVEKNLTQMYRGGIFDHIGYGFCRYSTDKYFLVPHFEKMLYDNALLMQCYIRAYAVSENPFFRKTAEQTAEYIMREMTSPEGGFYSAQDADSEGEEGSYYLLEYDEITRLLGSEEGKRFNHYYGITPRGNFEGKNIPNLLSADRQETDFKKQLSIIYKYRKERMMLHTDDKILTSWNSIMIAAFADMYRATENKNYLNIAVKAYDFIANNLYDGNRLYTGMRNGRRSLEVFLDDYAFFIYALIHLYEISCEAKYLDSALGLCQKVYERFSDERNGGFFLSPKEGETLISRPKEVYDGAIPCGNSVMAYNLVRLYHLTDDVNLKNEAQKQLEFMSAQVKEYPAGSSFFLFTLSLYLNRPMEVVCVVKDSHELFPPDAIVKILTEQNSDYYLKNNKTTYYVCKNNKCLPPVNSLEETYE